MTIARHRRAAIACVLAAVLPMLEVSCTRSGELHAPSIGAAAPVFTSMDVTGKPVTLAALKGKVVVINVWATWCQPCREEIPQLEALHQTYAAEGVTVVGVSVDAAGTGADVVDFAKEHHMSYPVWLDPDHEFALKFLTIGVPETFVIDKQGIIRRRFIGAVRPGDSTLVASVRSALGS